MFVLERIMDVISSSTRERAFVDMTQTYPTQWSSTFRRWCGTNSVISCPQGTRQLVSGLEML
jgi:hypothetical protein